MKLKYVGDPLKGGEGPDEVSYYGVTFKKGEWVEVDEIDKDGKRETHLDDPHRRAEPHRRVDINDPDGIARLAHNTHFIAEGESKTDAARRGALNPAPAKEQPNRALPTDSQEVDAAKHPRGEPAPYQKGTEPRPRK